MLTVTDNAAIKVKELLNDEADDSLALRVAAQPAGCSGYKYEMFFDSDISEDDKSEEVSGIKVVVDSNSVRFLEGATLDYQDTIENSGFKIDNPNAKSSCGCGKNS